MVVETEPDSSGAARQETPRIIGCGYAQRRESKHYKRHTHHGYLGFMYVVPEHRGNGLNRRVIERAAAAPQGLRESRVQATSCSNAHGAAGPVTR